MAYAPESVNPRRLRERFQSWGNKRVSVGTTTNHYLVGTWRSLDTHEARFEIGDQEMTVKVAEIAAISEAQPLQADFFK